MTTTLDVPRGLAGVMVDTTAISCVDGTHGVLSYRGVSIDDLVTRPFPEVASLVIFGEFQTDFAERLTAAADLSARERALVLALPRALHPMHVLQGVTPLLDTSNAFPEQGPAAQGFAIAAKLPAILAQHLRGPQLAAAELRLAGTAPHDPNARFLRLIDAPTTDAARGAFEVTQILQLEHSFNASTFAARVVASTLAPVQNALAAAFGALHGPLHGGADQAALETADRVGDPPAAAAFVDNCLAKGVKVMGMGHREYQVVDPRARYVKRLARELTLGTEHERTYQTLVAMEDRFAERMAERGRALHANLEFYKGLIYRVLGLPPSAFTATFALARVFGYVAHFIESRQDNRLIRPAARYVGPAPGTAVATPGSA